MKKILILGENGMLGNCVHKYLGQKGYSCFTILERIDYKMKTIDYLPAYCEENNIDFIINCIGLIPQKEPNNFNLNFSLPVWLSENCKDIKIIHPGTNEEDEIPLSPYGEAKKKAAFYITTQSKNTKIIKTSIIGHDFRPSKDYGLLDWYLNNNCDFVYGFVNHFWNGNTTLTWAQYAEDMIENWDNYDRETILQAPVTSKYDILKFAQNVYDSSIKVIPFKHEKDRTHVLIGSVQTKNIKEQLFDLKDFYAR